MWMTILYVMLWFSAGYGNVGFYRQHSKATKVFTYNGPYAYGWQEYLILITGPLYILLRLVHQTLGVTIALPFMLLYVIEYRGIQLYRKIKVLDTK